MEQGWSGTSLQGLKINGWLEGEARCVLPDGTVYEGQFKGGNFHGKGSLIYPGEGRYEAEWQEGRAISGRFLFSDGLLYQIHDWSYLASNDRRLVGEVRGGFNAQQALHVRASDVPAGTYDAGNGYFSKETGEIRTYDGSSAEVPNTLLAKWILKQCRRGNGNTCTCE